MMAWTSRPGDSRQNLKPKTCPVLTLTRVSPPPAVAPWAKTALLHEGGGRRDHGAITARSDRIRS